MAAFNYTALDQQGKLQNGVIEGDSPRQVRQLLRQKDLIPVTIEEIKRRESSPGKFQMHQRRKISSAELALITRQLATLIRSGTVLEESLKAVADQSEQDRIKSVLLAVRAKVVEGHSLAVALAQFPAIFQELYRATVAAGEKTGYLDLVLERLADYTEFSQQLRQKMILALLYPVLLTGVAFAVVTAMMVYVVPQVVKVFDNMGQELPFLTRALIMASGLLKSYGLISLITVLGLIILFRLALRREGARCRFHHLLLKLPLVAKGIKTLNAARFARTFSILTASGVSVLEGLQISAQVLSNLAIRQAATMAASRVREGASLNRSLAQCGFFPPITIHMIASGEASSKLDMMLERVATIHEREIETMVVASLAIFEPLLILLMGGVVLVIVLAILMPIFDLNQLVH
jgi:general secretion pathway protein F